MVIGASNDKGYMPTSIDPETGEPLDRKDPKAIQIRPSDVHATLLTSLGQSLDHISNQQPQILKPMLK